MVCVSFLTTSLNRYFCSTFFSWNNSKVLLFSNKSKYNHIFVSFAKKCVKEGFNGDVKKGWRKNEHKTAVWWNTWRPQRICDVQYNLISCVNCSLVNCRNDSFWVVHVDPAMNPTRFLYPLPFRWRSHRPMNAPHLHTPSGQREYLIRLFWRVPPPFFRPTARPLMEGMNQRFFTHLFTFNKFSF